MAIAADDRAAIEEEVTDLSGLAKRLDEQTGSRILHRLTSRCFATLARMSNAREAEEMLEFAALELRRRWLDVSGAATHRSYRSPPSAQEVQTPTRRFENFGYERELQPITLEARCAAFFGPAPKGWRADHILFSSGQGAMTAILHLADSLVPKAVARPLAVAHAGAYFETAELLRTLPSLFRTVATGADSIEARQEQPDLILTEPVFYEARFRSVSTRDLIEKLLNRSRQAPIMIFDDTLTGVSANHAADILALEAAAPPAIIRLTSGLKLLQAGLELANVGVVSLYTKGDGEDASSRLRRLRSLLGLGPSFSAVAALEAPWFLDRCHTTRYSRDVFAHNAALARALASGNRSFDVVSHPAVDRAGDIAPFCVLRLRTPNLENYLALAAKIDAASAQLGLLFEQGGSFGFRGHRFDVVAPRDSEPFLRVAMGRRRGWSFRGALDLLADV